MAGHAQLKFVMTECSKTQIRLTWLISCHSRQDNQGISTLKDSENTLHSKTVKKVNFLNSQFQSIFLRLGQLCIQSIHDIVCS